MGRRPSIPPHHRILWPPGELARLRDSRLQAARSLRRFRPPLPPPSSSASWPLRSPAPPAAAAWDHGGVLPCFLGRGTTTVRYPLRKKLSAARAVAFLPPPPEVVDAFAGAPSAAAPDVVAAAH